MYTVEKSLLIEAGHNKDEMENSPTMEQVQKMSWQDRPNFATKNGKLMYCDFRCLSSYRGGGNCECINHPSERWLEVI